MLSPMGGSDVGTPGTLVVSPDELNAMVQVAQEVPRALVDLAGLISAAMRGLEETFSGPALLTPSNSAKELAQAAAAFDDSWRSSLLDLGDGVEDLQGALAKAARRYAETDTQVASGVGVG